MSAESHVVAVSMGDMNGIGPEVLIKSITRPEFAHITFVVCGNVSALHWWADLLDIDVPFYRMESEDDIRPGQVGIWPVGSEAALPEPGLISQTSGEIALEAIAEGVRLCRAYKASALVTAPISKEAVSLAGSKHPGHTEYLAELTETPIYDVMMLLASDELRVGLVTIHEPLAAVAALLDSEHIIRSLEILDKALRKQFGISNPTIDVLGLNPHAGDGGVIGREEIDLIRPAIAEAAKDGIHIRGPFPADGYFGSNAWKSADAVLAMYHDQGLIPFKILAFETGVNVTLGLPIIRTSPDHGTAFDIAGKNIADPSSFLHALRLAIRMSSV